VEDCLIARLSGALNSLLGERLLGKLKTQLEKSHDVIVDLTHVDYLDSAGLGALVSVQMSTKRKGYNCILTGLQGAPLEVMKSSQLLKIFQAQDSVETALEQIRNPQ
jgi:anti-sigma B factor antagonist